MDSVKDRANKRLNGTASPPVRRGVGLEGNTMQHEPFLDYEKMPPARGEYVLWCDGMGTGRQLNRSINRTAAFVLKLHRAFAYARKAVSTIRCYPVMDGLYVTTPSNDALRAAIRIAFVQYARDFISGRGTGNKFMMRAGLAYGPVVHGSDIPREAIADDIDIGDTKDAILLSPAMVLAYHAERSAPPFGIFVDDTAKTFPQITHSDDPGFVSNLFQWWRDDDEAAEVATMLYEQITFYLEKAKIHSVGIGYPVDKIRAHEALAFEYFAGLRKHSEAQQGGPPYSSPAAGSESGDL